LRGPKTWITFRPKAKQFFIFTSTGQFTQFVVDRFLKSSKNIFRKGPICGRSFWLADVSDMNSPAAFISEWLKKQEREDMKMYNMIACGSGSVAWLREGEVIDFEISVSRAGSDQLVERTKRLFHNHAT
jgi:hypothetical protein